MITSREEDFGESQYENMCKIYSSYEKICNDENSVDFSELLLRTVELLESNDEIKIFTAS